MVTGEDAERELERLLDGVYARRRSELLERADALLGWLLAAADGDRDAADSAAAEAHRMTGSLGSLGFLDESERMHRIEVALRRAPAGERAELAGGSVGDVRRVVAALQAAERRPRG